MLAPLPVQCRMASLESEAAQTEEAVATAAASAEADDVISNTYPAADTEVANRLVVTDVEMREMKADRKDFMKAHWMQQTNKQTNKQHHGIPLAAE